jgi:hypothetical protein
MFQQLMTFEAARTGFQQMDENAYERHLAAAWFERALRQGHSKRLTAGLLGRSRKLLDLSKVACKVLGQHYRGVQTVALHHIRGSENRTLEFDADFNPTEEHIEQRWMSVAVAYMKGVKLPPVALVQVGDTYYVRDGHHRISVAHTLGQHEIEAEIIVWDTA